MSPPYQPEQERFQDRFDTRRLAARLAEGTSDHVGEAHRAFIQARDLFFIASVDGDGQPQCSYKGGAPGFVQVPDERTLTFPVYDGNGMFLTAGNIDAHPQVGLLFMDLETGTRLRVNGQATIDPDPPDGEPGALFVVTVRVTSVFANCRRYVHGYRQVESSVFVPAADNPAPVPDWKRIDWFAGTLPADDPAHDPDHPSAPSLPQF